MEREIKKTKESKKERDRGRRDIQNQVQRLFSKKGANFLKSHFLNPE